MRLPRPTIPPGLKRALTALVVVVLILAVLFGTARFWVNLWWFDSMGYRSVLLRRYLAEILSFAGFGLVSGSIFLINGRLALRRAVTHLYPGGFRGGASSVFRWLIWILAILVGIGFGSAASTQWEMWILWLKADSYGLHDPIFHRDISFYFFALPALRDLAVGAIVLIALCIAMAAALYVLLLGLNFRKIGQLPGLVRVHLLVLAGLFFVGVGAWQVVQGFSIVYSTSGAAPGPGFTDVNVVRWVNWLLAACALAVGIVLILNSFLKQLRLLLGLIAGWAVLYVLLAVLLPPIVQSTVVDPSELKREKSYIANNIAMTSASFGLATVTERDLGGQQPVTQSLLAAEPATLSNVRLWDYRVAQTTFQQLESFVPYYVFLDVDVERYPDAHGGIQQVLVSARELDTNGLPANAKTWTNLRLVYTHGYGAVVSPVNAVTPQGLPAFVVNKIPPTGAGVYAITQPEIYFGEGNLDWVVVNTDQPEFSGLIDTSNPNNGSYAGQGAGSVTLDNYLKKLIVAIDLKESKLLTSGVINGDSRILLRRNIVDRAHEIAPFLTFDKDPYLVIADGRLVWVIDAYTTSNRFPGATSENGVNYIRNSVKVTIDAYDGTITFYRTAVADPIADAYGAVYPGLFKPVSEAPASIAAHFRYPEHLFDVQSEVYATIHVEDPTALYNGEDRWAVPTEQVNGQPARMEPYYVTMSLPEQTNPEFVLIRPFVPGGNSPRQNMTAWMAGGTDASGNLSLVVYRFPRQATVFGPRQIEARIDQEPEISSQISLWSQAGSSVIRGNLLVIPIGDSVLYVQPLYLQATAEQSALPELKRVIVASNEKVVMADTLTDALALLTSSTTGPAPALPAPPTEAGVTPNPQVADLVAQAGAAFDKGQAALKAGDWAAYGEAQNELAAILAQLENLTGSTPAAATPTAGATPVVQP
jgi:uncharacterized membrane protein (UPF0182 family)